MNTIRGKPTVVHTTAAIAQLKIVPRAFDPTSLSRWHAHTRSDAQRAVAALADLHKRTEIPGDGSAIEFWFGLAAQGHCFRASIQPWLSLIETQAVAGLAHFLRCNGPAAFLAFFRAIAPGLHPSSADHCSAEVEVPVPRVGRIDLVVRALDGSRQLAVVVEAKLGSSLHNPLDNYLAHARSKMALSGAEARFVVLDSHVSAKTKQQLSERGEWSFLSWHIFLKRLENELAAAGIDDSHFAVHRRHIWERI